MKQIPVAGKALTLLFAAMFLVACSGNDTKDADEAAAREAAMKAQQAEEMAREKDRMAQAAAAEAQRQLESAAMAAGTVFYFDYDSSTMTPAARAAVDAHIALLKTNDRSVRLDGHTDERGTRDYNMALGERRANAVRDYMVVNGVASYRIESVSYGEEQPVAYGSGESSWSQNRRVELK
ncbi:MAG: peptidoglycan-associated lipoprotein Pal [Congregibacter sp.]|nr:peptidoglycan-associated lipoprotein Pal [Congregibacter sp.]MDP5072047.1 peptidoglycan-associated lipoprotein Pal [Congregibacter sp.]